MTATGDERLRRTLLVILLAVLALPVIAFAALWIWVASTQGKPPAMFADVPRDFTDDQLWVARMNVTFPTGTPEAVLVQRLRSEGFEVDPLSREGRYEWGNGIPCNHTVEVGWSADSGRITAGRARYMNACW